MSYKVLYLVVIKINWGIEATMGTILLAYNKKMDWSIVRIDSKIYLDKSPYWLLHEISEEDYKIFVMDNGFVEVKEIASEYNEETIQKLFGSLGGDVTNEDRIKFFASVPEGFLEVSVDKVEEYINRGEYRRSIFSGTALLNNKGFSNYPKLYVRLYNLMSKIQP